MKTFEAMFRKLEGRLPSLTAILEIFDSAEYLTGFVELVHKYLPKHQDDILRFTDAESRCQEFVRIFSEEYFELAEYDFSDEGYQQLSRSVPIPLEGLSYSDYEDFGNNYSPEWVVMASLVCYPFYRPEGKDGAEDRVTLMEAAADLVGVTTTDRIPAAGFKPEELHKKLDKTKYEGLASFADWLCSDTGCWKLDVNYEDDPEGPDWDEETVAELVRQEPIMLDIQKKVTLLETWLHEDLRSHFAELVNAVVGRPVPKEQLTLMEVFNE
jgi:hypothetical protein